jgi:phosphate transport system protein
MTTKSRLTEEVEGIRSGLVELASRSLTQIERAVTAWESIDPDLAAEVIAQDEEIDELCAQLDWRIYEIQLLQSPVAGDQRLLHVGLIAAIALERVGDLAVEISVAASSVPAAGRVPEVQNLIAKMSARAVDSLARAVQAIARSDVELADEALAESGAVRDMLDDVIEASTRAGDEPETKAWSATAVLVGRHLERVANNARELAGRVEFLVDGQPFRRVRESSG